MSQLSNTGERERIKETRDCLVVHGPPFRFYAKLFVEHPPSYVWSCFSNLDRWAAWSPICCGCRLIHPGELQLGSIIEIRLKVLGLRLTVPVRVVQFKPPESITWQGEKFGIRAFHTYSFLPHEQGTLLCNYETLSGASFPFNRLIAACFRLSKVSGKSLKGLSRELGEATSSCTSNC